MVSTVADCAPQVCSSEITFEPGMTALADPFSRRVLHYEAQVLETMRDRPTSCLRDDFILDMESRCSSFFKELRDQKRSRAAAGVDEVHLSWAGTRAHWYVVVCRVVSVAQLMLQTSHFTPHTPYSTLHNRYCMLIVVPILNTRHSILIPVLILVLVLHSRTHTHEQATHHAPRPLAPPPNTSRFLNRLAGQIGIQHPPDISRARTSRLPQSLLVAIPADPHLCSYRHSQLSLWDDA